MFDWHILMARASPPKMDFYLEILYYKYFGYNYLFWFLHLNIFKLIFISLTGFGPYH